MTPNGTYTQAISLDRIEPDQDNPYLHPADQLAALQDSIQRHGYVRRIVVQALDNDGLSFVLVAGHGVYTALRLEGYRSVEATVIPADWPEAQVKAYLMADNEIGRMADRDPGLAAALLSNILDAGQLAPEGMTPEELDKLLEEAGDNGGEPEDQDPQEDLADLAEEDLVAKWSPALGQLWEAGDHLVYCGDALDPDSWDALLGRDNPHVAEGIFTSPPYAEQRKDRYGGIAAGDFVEWWIDNLDPLIAANLDPRGSLFVNLKANTATGRRLTYDKRLILALEDLGWAYFEEYAWTKPGRPGEYKNRFKNAWEPVHQLTRDPENLIANIEAVFERRTSEMNASREPLAAAQGHNLDAYKTVGRYAWDGDVVRPSNVLKVNHDSTGIEGEHHPARFPVALAEFFVKAYSWPGQAWLDPFVGSGTLLLACERTGRHGRGIDIQPANLAICLERLQRAGLEPRRLL